MNMSIKNMKTEDMAKIGTAAMAIGAAAAVAAGVVNSRNSTKHKMKKIARKTAKNMDNIVNTMQYMFK